MSNYRRGASFENSIAKRFDNHGFLAVRAAGSGTTTRTCVDVVAINDEVVVLCECKTHGDDSVGRKLRYNLEQFDDAYRRVVGDGGDGKIGRRVFPMLVAKNRDGGVAEYFDISESSLVVPGDGVALYEFINQYGE